MGPRAGDVRRDRAGPGGRRGAPAPLHRRPTCQRQLSRCRRDRVARLLARRARRRARGAGCRTLAAHRLGRPRMVGRRHAAGRGRLRRLRRLAGDPGFLRGSRFRRRRRSSGDRVRGLARRLPRAEADAVRRPDAAAGLGPLGTAFIAVLGGEIVGSFEVDTDLTRGGTNLALRGWADECNHWVREDLRSRGIGTWLVSHGAAWMRLGASRGSSPTRSRTRTPNASPSTTRGTGFARSTAPCAAGNGPRTDSDAEPTIS